MMFCNVQGTPKLVQQIFEISFRNRPKIHSKSIPEALQNQPQNKRATKTPTNQKSAANGLPQGGARVDLECDFQIFWGSWAPLGATMAPRPRPRALRTPPNLDFCDFRSLLGRFWEDFGWICVTMSSRIVTRVMCVNTVPQTLLHVFHFRARSRRASKLNSTGLKIE